MAKIIETFNNISEYPNSFKRQGAFPLDSKSVFQSLNDAKSYAQDTSDSATSYVGQIISVVENNTVNVYKIVDTAGNLELIGTQADWEAASGVAAILNKPNMRSGVDLSGNIDNTTIILAGNNSSQAYVQNGIAVGPGSVAGGFAFLVKEVGRYDGTKFVSETTGGKSINAFKLITTADANEITIDTILKGDKAGEKWSGNGKKVTFKEFDWDKASISAGEPFSFQTTRWSPIYTTVQEVVTIGKIVIIVFQDSSYQLNSTDAQLISRGGLSSSGWCCWFPQRPTYGTVRITDISDQESPPEKLTCIALGISAKARNIGAIAIGRDVLADGPYSMALTKGATAKGQYAIAAAQNAIANGEYAIAIGQNASASDIGAIALGRYTKAEGNGAVAIGLGSFEKPCQALGAQSFAFGYSCSATGGGSIAGGIRSIASGWSSIALGQKVQAIGGFSFALGESSIAKGFYSFAFGTSSNTASDTSQGSPVYSYHTTASGNYSFAFGCGSQARGEASFAFGAGPQKYGDIIQNFDKMQTIAGGSYSFAFGQGIHTSNDYEIAFGRYNNTISNTTIFSIGNGSSHENRHNLFQINQDGSVYLSFPNELKYESLSLQEHISKLYGFEETLNWLETRIDKLEAKPNS